MTEPWSPPDDEWEASAPLGPFAGFGVRLAAWLIDGLLLGFANAALFELTSGFGDVNRELGDMGWRSYVLASFLALTYSTILLGSPSGQTLGMRVMGIRALDAQTGGRVDYGRCVVRYVVSIASGFVLFLGYLWMLGDPRRQTWHDRAAGTVVVPVEVQPPARDFGG